MVPGFRLGIQGSCTRILLQDSKPSYLTTRTKTGMSQHTETPHGLRSEARVASAERRSGTFENDWRSMENLIPVPGRRRNAVDKNIAKSHVHLSGICEFSLEERKWSESWFQVRIRLKLGSGRGAGALAISNCCKSFQGKATEAKQGRQKIPARSEALSWGYGKSPDDRGLYGGSFFFFFFPFVPAAEWADQPTCRRSAGWKGADWETESSRRDHGRKVSRIGRPMPEPISPAMGSACEWKAWIAGCEIPGY